MQSIVWCKVQAVHAVQADVLLRPPGSSLLIRLRNTLGAPLSCNPPPLWWILMPSQYFLFRSFFDGNCFCNGSPLKAFICPISRTSYRNKSGAPLYWGILLPVCWVRMQSEFYFSSPVSCSCSTTLHLHCTRFCGWIPYRGWNTFNAPLS